MARRTSQNDLADAVRAALRMAHTADIRVIYTAGERMSADEYRRVIRDAIRSTYRPEVIEAWDAEA